MQSTSPRPTAASVADLPVDANRQCSQTSRSLEVLCLRCGQTRQFPAVPPRQKDKPSSSMTAYFQHFGKSAVFFFSYVFCSDSTCKSKSHQSSQRGQFTRLETAVLLVWKTTTHCIVLLETLKYNFIGPVCKIWLNF